MTAYFAVAGLRVWRAQINGRRRFEIAEEAVLAAHRVKESLRFIRTPGSMGEETDANLIRASDHWLKRHFGAYASWAIAHDSLLIITWDEDEYTKANRIPTILVGAQVKPGRYDQALTHYNVLRMVEESYDLPLAGASANAAPIANAVP